MSVETKSLLNIMNNYQLTFSNAFQVTNDPLCDFFQHLALETWNRIDFIYNTNWRNGLKINEVTITENILFQLAYHQSYSNLSQRVSLYEAKDEKANGNDIELYVEIEPDKQGNPQCLFIALQAKILGRKGIYDYISDYNSNGSQIELLCRYAKNNGGIPLYLLYNYIKPENLLTDPTICNITFDNSQYGCSLVSAKYIFDKYAVPILRVKVKHRKPQPQKYKLTWRDPKVGFSNLHPYPANPWFILACCDFSGKSLSEAADKLTNGNVDSGYKLKGHSIDGLVSDRNWRTVNLANPVKNEGPNYYNDRREPSGFLPRFRIIIKKMLG